MLFKKMETIIEDLICGFDLFCRMIKMANGTFIAAVVCRHQVQVPPASSEYVSSIILGKFKVLWKSLFFLLC